MLTLTPVKDVPCDEIANVCLLPATLSVKNPVVLPEIRNLTEFADADPLAAPLRPKEFSAQFPETLLPAAAKVPVRLICADGLAQRTLRAKFEPPPEYRAEQRNFSLWPPANDARPAPDQLPLSALKASADQAGCGASKVAAAKSAAPMAAAHFKPCRRSAIGTARARR